MVPVLELLFPFDFVVYTDILSKKDTKLTLYKVKILLAKSLWFILL